MLGVYQSRSERRSQALVWEISKIGRFRLERKTIKFLAKDYDRSERRPIRGRAALGDIGRLGYAAAGPRILGNRFPPIAIQD